MRTLSKTLKPEVIFDPEKREHRKAVADFFKNKSWRGCPYRFLVNDNSLDLTAVLKRQLVEYYTNREFFN
jgi:hypothetical protein